MATMLNWYQLKMPLHFRNLLHILPQQAGPVVVRHTHLVEVQVDLLPAR